MIARAVGSVVATIGETVVAALPSARVGDGVRLFPAGGGAIPGRVSAIQGARAAIAPFGPLWGIAAGDRVESDPSALLAPAGIGILGRAVAATGLPLDGRGDLRGASAAEAPALTPSARRAVTRPCWTGVRAVDALLTIGRGARVGIFGPPGTGKSTLLETLVAGVRCDAVVIALVGERGREAERWIARLDARTTVFCASGDCSAPERLRAAEMALGHASVLRARGLSVFMVIDSLARYATALREIHVALGEPVGPGGFPPSVWPVLARYVERAGETAQGSITLVASVLTENPGERDPLADAARSLLDGHIVLSAALAGAGRHPAVDVLASVSRTMPAVASAPHLLAARALRAALAALAATEEARSLGFARDGGGAAGTALAAEAALEAFLRQSEPASPEETLSALAELAASLAL